MTDILIFDHEPYRSQSLARGLRIMGFHVFEAATPREAVAYLKSPDTSIHIMITDCSTQVLNRSELTEALNEDFRDFQCVIMTDSDKRSVEAPSAWRWPIHSLVKPFTVMQLVYLITRLLRSQSQKTVTSDMASPMRAGTECKPGAFLSLRPR